MEVFYLIGSVQSLFLATLFLSKQSSRSPQKILIGVFLIIGILLLDHYLELSGVLDQYPHLLGIAYTLPLLLGPALLLYTLLVIRKDTPSFRSFLMSHSWPFLLSTIYLGINYYFLPSAGKQAFYQQQTLEPSWPIVVIELLLILAVPVYSIWSILLIKNHRKRIKNEFSYTENISLKWWEIILVCFVLLSLISIVLNIISDGIRVIEYQLADSIVMGGLTFAIFFIGYYGIKQKAIYPTQGKDSVKKPAEPTADIDPSSLEEITDSIETEKLYRNSTLTLRDLAEHFNTTENKLSYLINNGLNKSFYDLINEYRVEEVKKLLLDPSYDHLSILGIAFESGFNSKSSFQNVFRKQTGMTPSQFKEQSLQKKSESTL